MIKKCVMLIVTTFRNWWYIDAVTGLFIPTQTPAMRALLSKLVPADEVLTSSDLTKLYLNKKTHSTDKQKYNRQTGL